MQCQKRGCKNIASVVVHTRIFGNQEDVPLCDECLDFALDTIKREGIDVDMEDGKVRLTQCPDL